MRFIVSTALSVVFALSVMAVDIVIYPNSVSCDDNSGGLQCGNIAQLVCCHNGGGDIFSVRCSGLDTTGVPDFCTIGVGPGPDAAWCQSNCNSAGGSSIICIDPGSCPAATGSFWVSGGGSRLEGDAIPTKCQGTVKPDAAVFTNGQKFRINYDIPANVTALLIELVKTDPHLSQAAPKAILPYEIKEEKES
ncbi:hypothetical protein AURDEDRAFT_160475 [Auricularia subglabra TFB-10046 SS5]|nr:hypothetical protein AURDEDRAFT_160475 [Auricularia subglabra TFB-10046 SS5]